MNGLSLFREKDKSLSHVNIINLNGWVSASEIPRGINEQSEDLYHATDHESAVDILNGRGIHLSAGRQKRDSSSGKGST